MEMPPGSRPVTSRSKSAPSPRSKATSPAAALRTAVEVAGEVALLRGDGALLLRLVTGREPGGISIV